MNDRITLNVGGVPVQTTVTVLTSIAGSWFHDLLASSKPQLDENGNFFIDRSPKHFTIILDFLKTGDVVLPDDEYQVQEILKEAIHYNLGGLINECNANKKIRTIENDLKMLQIIARSPRPVLIIHYTNMEDLGLVFVPPNTASQFEINHRHWFDIYFKENTTPVHGSWSFSIHDTTKNVYTMETFEVHFFYLEMLHAMRIFIDNRSLMNPQ